MIPLAVLIVGVFSLDATPGQRIETISGTIVAHDLELVHACFDSICGGSLIVRLDKPRQTQTYVVVDFAYQDKSLPYDYFNSHARGKFTVVRSPEDEVPLRQFFDFYVGDAKEKSESNISKWVLMPGAEKEELPYGKVLVSYHLAKNLTKDIWKSLGASGN
jgi:hypothetical protein